LQHGLARPLLSFQISLESAEAAMPNLPKNRRLDEIFERAAFFSLQPLAFSFFMRNAG
jgi:hypothetical protein